VRVQVVSAARRGAVWTTAHLPGGGAKDAASGGLARSAAAPADAEQAREPEDGARRCRAERTKEAL